MSRIRSQTKSSLLVVGRVAGWVEGAGPSRASATAVETSDAAERNFPPAVVGLHGVLAATTLVLVFLATIGVGD